MDKLVWFGLGVGCRMHTREGSDIHMRVKGNSTDTEERFLFQCIECCIGY
jgi:hypothetical protein